MSDAQFVRYKSLHAMSWAHVNARRLADHPSATLLRAATPGGSTLVVGAGPSLDVDAVAASGLRVVAPNAAAVALIAGGVVPDVVVARESLDLSDQVQRFVEAGVRWVVLDIASHPDTWAAAGDHLAWYIPLYPRQVELARMLGVDPVASGTSALTAAVALASRWWGPDVTLAGVDLAFAPDGRTYHGAAPRGGMIYADDHDGHGPAVSLGGDTAHDDERCERSGQRPPQRRIRAGRAMAWDWSRELTTISTLDDQAEWLEEYAVRHPGAQLLNASRGRGLRGWVTADLPEEDADGALIADSAAWLGRSVVDAALQRLTTQAITAETLACEMLSPRGPDLALLARVHGLFDGTPFSDSMAAHELVDLPESIDPVERVGAVYGAIRRAARRGQDLLAGRVPDEAVGVRDAG